LNFVGRHNDALTLMLSRLFHPWEGGEGKVLAQYRFARIALGCELLQRGDAAGALEHFTSASVPPRNLGEEFHFLQSRADVNYWRGRALSVLGYPKDAEGAYLSSAEEAQDFQAMAVRLYSPYTYYRGLSLLALKRDLEAQQLFAALREHAEGVKKLPAKIDYFATSLPNMLVFDADLSRANQIDGLFLEGLSLAGLGRFKEAQICFFQVLKLDASHLDAKQQLRLGNTGLFTNWPASSTSE
jgi:tetratricopeptide (TPR) repeat protein